MALSVVKTKIESRPPSFARAGAVPAAEVGVAGEGLASEYASGPTALGEPDEDGWGTEDAAG
jgi:hypothetical protein